ncbi:NUDIX hydrolase [Glaciibacter psychrotolerans]|uniref:ADP-ribose pyrophosphatase YjhB (NUDIX family) n=1 Tax=Glaciibacter psychrotolerans TaxID=670054 RepID=A0A7Z0EDL1_9MICO|nr:NUDIX domain-containing protein [Leifsonia psychrotolerans]NYJ19668.1 ADP-ribose pyrophosphatase YjhB (NUDIX family) [Leifsonia psychrotolerans]
MSTAQRTTQCTTLSATLSATLAVSTVIFALRPVEKHDDAASGVMTLWLPLVRRTSDPHRNQWALPGGWLPNHEELAAAAARTLRETTSLTPTYLEQLYTFGAIGRSPGRRVVSVVYWALVKSDEAAQVAVGDNVRWFPADSLPQLAFDHNRIVEYALWRLRTKVEYSRIAHSFLGETFTLAQLREVHEAVLHRSIDPANFRRRVEASGDVVETGEFLAGTRHRPPRLYRFNDASPPATPPPSGRRPSDIPARPHSEEAP